MSSQHEGTAVKPVKLVLHIERLRLHGVAPEQRDALVAGLETGLAQALVQDGVAERWAGSGHRERVRLQVPGSADPAALGESAARSMVTGGAS